MKGRKAAQERFSEESLRVLLHFANYFPETRFSNSTASSSQNPEELTAHSKPGLTRGTLQL